MASLSDLSLKDRFWYHRYSFRQVAPLTWSPLRAPLHEARIALVTSAGIHRPEDVPFRREKGGDWSWRVIPRESASGSLVCTHPSAAWDRSGFERDSNVVFPIDRLGELVDDGVVGDLAPRHASFQGSITAPGRLVARSAAEMAEVLTGDGVDGAVLTPV